MRNLSELPALPTTVLAALALAVPVATETVVEGISEAWWGHTLFVGSQLVAWSLLLVVLSRLRRTGGDGSRARRVGAALTLAGCVLQLAFITVYAGSVVATGEAHDAVFVPFSLGFLALTSGGATWGLSLRRTPELRTAGIGLLLVAGLGLGAILIPVDRWHEVALVGSYLAWIVVGRGLGQSSSSSASARSSLAVGRAALGSGWRPAR